MSELIYFIAPNRHHGVPKIAKAVGRDVGGEGTIFYDAEDAARRCAMLNVPYVGLPNKYDVYSAEVSNIQRVEKADDE